MKLEEAFAKRAYGRSRSKQLKAKYGSVEFTQVVYEYHMSYETYDRLTEEGDEELEKAIENWPAYKNYSDALYTYAHGANNIFTLTFHLPSIISLKEFQTFMDTTIKDLLDV